jgi:hypothetical protein
MHEDIQIHSAKLSEIDSYIVISEIFKNDKKDKFNLNDHALNSSTILKYSIIIDNKQFDIEKVNFDNNNNLISIVTIKPPDTDGNVSTYNNKPVTKLLLRKKNISTIRDNYKSIGYKIDKSNKSILESKKKIKHLEKYYKNKKNIAKNLEIRYYVNIAIFSIITLIYLYLSIFTLDKSLNIKIAFFIFIVIAVLIFVNYMLRVKTIERFIAEEIKDNMAERFTVEPIDTKYSIIKSDKATIDKKILELLKTAKYYLDSMDNIEIYSVLSTSLTIEKNKFASYEKAYKNKKYESDGTIEIIKHSIIKLSAFIVMLSVSFLIFSLSYIIYLFKPNLIKFLYIISVLIIIINLIYYFIVIREPVRVKSRNNYWVKPSDATLSNINL